MGEPWVYIYKDVGVFAAEVPFLPPFSSTASAGDWGPPGSRLAHLHDRQLSLLNGLAQISGDNTFELRFIYRPLVTNVKRSSHVTVVFVGKTQCEEEQRKENIRAATLALWENFKGCYPLEEPFHYPLVPINVSWLNQRDNLLGISSRNTRAAFEHHVLTPIPPGAIRSSRTAELRKIRVLEEELTAPSTTAGTASGPWNIKKILFESSQRFWRRSRLLGAIPRLSPRGNISWHGRVLETLVDQRQACLLRIALRPTFLEMSQQERILKTISDHREQVKSEGEEWVRLYKTRYLKMLEEAWDEILLYKQRLFLLCIQVVGAEEYPETVAAALITGLGMNQPEFPPPLELIASAETDSIIRSDIKHIDHTPWHKAGLRLWDGALVIPPLVDPMRFVVTAKEAVGVFQLPVPPESGYLPGIRVREEPFVRSQRFGGESLDQLHLGEVLHRGTPSGEQFFISKENLGRHALIAGSTGTGKTYTCLHLLSQLWDRTKDGRRVPFLVIYPVAKPDYRILMDDPVVRDDLLIFTAGDASSPLRFNPFDVPWGVLLRTHISNLMRTFSAALYMWGPLPMLFREALRQVYTEFGWNLHGRRGDDPEQRIPQLRHFHRVLQELSENWAGRYRSDLRGDLRQDSEVKIRDLLESAGNILDVSYDIGKPSIIEQILERPTVIELGRVGSASDIALVVGFLLTLLTEHISTRSDGSLRHLTLIEEAHRLMSAQVNVQGEHVADPRRGGAEEFAHILAEVRGYGEALMLAEQTPTKLIPDAIANTHLKVMHWLEDRLSFDLFSQIMNLNDKQRNHARTLQVGEIITRAESGEPVLLKVPNYRKLLEEKLRARDEKLAKTSTSDQAVEEFMKDQIESKGIAIPQYLAAERQRSSSGGFKTTQSPPGDVQASLPSGRESERNTGEGGKKDDFLRRLHTQREKHNG